MKLVQACFKAYTSVESELDDLDYLVTWVTLLMSQANVICQLNYLDVTQIFKPGARLVS